MMSMNLCDIAILNIIGVNYRGIISGISNSEAANLSIQVTKVEHYKT